MSCCCQKTAPEAPEPQASNSALWLRLALCILLGGLSMYLSLGVNISNPIGTTRNVLHSLLALVSAGVIFGIGGPMFRSAWESAQQRKITLEHAFLIGILGSFAASLYSSISGEGAIYYEVVVILIGIYTFGQAITALQIKRQSELSKSIPGLGGQALLRDGSEIAIASITLGQELTISPGDYVPVDGTILSGAAYIEQQAHTGETYPQVRSQGDSLLAGSLVLDGEIILKATSTGKTREIDRLLASLSSPSSLTTHTQLLTQKILNAFVPIVLGIAVLTGLTWTFFGQPIQGWLNAITVTVVACPCALGVAIPLAIRKGLTNLRLLGIIPKQADFIDRLASIEAVAFDKTGTLSKPRLELEKLELSDNAPAQLTDWIIAVQNKSTHPVARPFWSLKPNSEIASDSVKVEPIPGRGIKATINGEEILIGNSQLAAEENIGTLSNSRSLFVIYRDQLVATAHLREEARETSRETLNRLHTQGLHTSILTGDATIPADYHRDRLNIHTSLSSAEKANILKGKREATLYIGDGLNDCEGFQHAAASLALKGGSPAAVEVAQAILSHDDLTVIPEAIEKIKALQARLKKILLFSFLYNLAGITLAALGHLHPVVAAILMFASSITVIAAVNRAS